MSLRILITGAGGYLGRRLLEHLRQQQPHWQLIATSRRTPFAQAAAGLLWQPLDVSDRAAVLAMFAAHRPHAVVHLAAVLNPPAEMSHEQLRTIEVDGTRHVLDAALAHGCQQVIVSSSGAAYGYHADNPAWLTEDMPLRGHPAFAYAQNKVAVEALLDDYRAQHTQLKQLILRIGTVLGPNTDNLISDLFRKPWVLGVRGSQSPFVFIWDEDVVEIIRLGLLEQRSGCFNLAGDGAVPLAQIAAQLGKPFVAPPAWLLKSALKLLNYWQLSQYHSDQVDFLRYRPVLCNRRLKEQFGYTPRFTSEQALAAFIAAQSTAAPA